MVERTERMLEARAELARFLQGLSLLPIAESILDAVEERGDEPFEIMDAVRMAGREKLDSEVLATMMHLAQGRCPALERYVVFKDAAGTEFELSNGEWKGFDAPLAHPVTGEDVPDPESCLYMRFRPTPGLLPDPAPSGPGL